jgi:hypothetical protein
VPGFDVRFHAAPDVVFAYLADPRNRPEWQSSLRAVEVLDDGEPRTGLRWVDRTVLGIGPVMEIVGMQPPGEQPGTWAESGTWHGVRASLSLTFLPVPGAADATVVRTLVDFPAGAPWLLPVRAVLRVLAPPAVRSDLRRAARIVGSR